MSFILDALKKSESERQRQASPALADVATRAEKQRMPVWLWLLGALLLLNVAVLLGIYFRPAPVEATLPSATPIEAREPSRQMSPDPVIMAEPSPAPREETRPLAAEASSPTVNEQPASQEVVSQVREPSAPAAEDDFDSYPTYANLLASGSIRGEELHIDIHVYSDAPADRFVFINMNKYREGQRLAEGPTLIAITQTGVILQQGAYRFLLPRE